MKNNCTDIPQPCIKLWKYWFALVSFLMLGFSPLNSQTQSSDFSFWVSGSTGLYTGGYEIDDALLIGTDMSISWKHNLISLQLNYAPDYLVEDNRSGQEIEYQLYEYSGLYGYQRDFAGGKIFAAAGISYFDLKEELPPIGEPTNSYMELNEINKLGLPIKIGFTASFSKNVAITNSYFINFNGNQNYFGYQVALQFGLFQ